MDDLVAGASQRIPGVPIEALQRTYRYMEQSRGIGPDFLGIGAQRCGTSWLHQVLESHPAIWMPPIKELHYFDDPTRKERYFRFLRMRLVSGLWFRHPLSAWDIRYFFGRPSDRWYDCLFEPGRRLGLLTGEITPSYCMLDEEMLTRILNMNPKVKLLFIMRDPVMRSWSSVIKSRLKHGATAFPSGAGAINHARREGVWRMSSYADIIERLERVFSREQVFYGFFDDLSDRPELFVTKVLEFLGVEAENVWRLLPRSPVNVAATGRQPPLEFERELAAFYLPTVRKLCERFEGAPQTWLRRYEATVDGQPQAVLDDPSHGLTTTGG